MISLIHLAGSSRPGLVATIVALVLGLSVLAPGCGEPERVGDAGLTDACAVVSPPVPPTDPEPVASPVEIVDQAGHVWDITSAVVKYGFDADGFQYGLGAGRIPAIVRPQFEPAAAASGIDDDGLVIGVARGEEARAYPLSTLRLHEVANDAIDGMHYAASY
jgi:uncharacterized protein DUF3179